MTRMDFTLQIVEREEGEVNTWNFGEVTSDVAIKGFGGATLLSTHPKQTAELLEKVMGLEQVGKEGDFVRFRSPAEIGNIIDLKLTSIGRGQMGVGTVHHIAWRASDDQDQLEWKQYVEGMDMVSLLYRIETTLMRFTLENMGTFYLKLQRILQDSLMMNHKKRWEKN